MDYTYIKAIHMVAVISWMASLLYIVRLYIYHTEAHQNESEPDFAVIEKHFVTMERRLLRGIGTPAMLVALIFGIWMISKAPVIKQGWFHLKMLLLLGLFYYHGKCSKIRKLLEKRNFKYSSKYLRIFNEVATVLMIAIVFPAVTKSTISALWGIIGFAVLVAIILFFMKKKCKSCCQC